jgi:hypothetical protein
VHDFDARLPDWSIAARAQDDAELQLLETALDAHVAQHVAPDIDIDAARSYIAVRQLELQSGHFIDRNPALWTGEAIFGVVSLMIRNFAPAATRIPGIIARLAATPAFLATLRAELRGGTPSRWVERAVRECTAADGLFDRGLRAWLVEHHIDAATSAYVLTAAVESRQAFAETREFLATITTSDERGYAIGADAFARLLAHGHASDESVDALLAEALASLPGEQDRLTTIATDVAGSWSNAQAAMAADHPTAAGYLDAFTTRWQECRRLTLAHDAVTWPEWPIRYAPIPAWAAEFAPQLYWLFYRSPAPFDPYDVYEYVVTPIDATLTVDEQSRRLRAWNHSTITLNHVVHHGAVGHHVQNWHARYRSISRIGAVAATDCASRIGMFLGGSMAEGWACYATQLMEELGMLTPLERVSEQHTRVRMLARAIIDIRLHCGLATFAECVQYYQDVVGMSADVALAETTKNSMFPCTAIMYWLGTTRILNLRETLKKRIGDAFSLRTFHDDLLQFGALPVPLVARRLTEEVA